MIPNLTTISTLGLAHHRNGVVPFGLRLADRLLHLHVIGMSGTGKSTLLANLALQDAKNGIGFCLIDPHGDLARDVADRLADDVIHWTLADPDCSYGYNPLTHVPLSYRPLVASGLIEALKKQWADAWGARMEHLLRYAVLALLDHPHADLAGIMEIFIDKDYRREVIAHIQDDQVRRFWTQEFPAMNYKTAFDGVAPIANKLGAFLAHPVLRTSLCQPKEPLRFRRLMDEGRPLIINLSKGRLGADLANVTGGLLLSSLINAAFSRQDQPALERRPYMLLIDEFHNFTTQAIADVLPETRKYGLGLTLAHQHVAQVEPALFDAILGNTGSLMAFRLGPNDAPLIARQLEIDRLADLTNLANHRVYSRLMVDGQRTRAFSGETVPPARDESAGSGR